MHACVCVYMCVSMCACVMYISPIGSISLENPDWYKNMHPVNNDFSFQIYLHQVPVYHYFYIYKHQLECSIQWIIYFLQRNSVSRLPLDSKCNSSLGLQPVNLPCRFWLYWASTVTGTSFLKQISLYSYTSCSFYFSGESWFPFCP